MTKPHRGRPAGRAHRTVGGANRTRKRDAFAHALRRPMASLAAVVAVSGASAAGYASAANPHTSPASFTPAPASAAQAAELARNQSEASESSAAARRSAVLRDHALTQKHKADEARAAALSRARKAAAAQSRARAAAAAAELSRARAAAAAAELSRAREVASQRVARDQRRQSLLARAQSDPKAVARQLSADRGWGSEQFGCLSSLWAKESGWRWDADNPSSDAYGIPQSLPGSKMASFGNDWETNPVTQIKWGLGYISDTYGTPCSAWAKSQASNWY